MEAATAPQATDVAIRFDRVAKRYRLHRGWDSRSLGDAATRLVRRLRGENGGGPQHFRALHDVSFEIRRGESVGLIGANGAGKSTTLKILSRVTVPSSGAFELRGRLGALIEIGAGFHGELTGRENVYLNGAILGMRRVEIEAKFDQIVAFAEVERFIDTPIKYYSSGMDVRLGFAVAAHIEPDVLLVDEVLAVGDAAFQAKCLNKLAELKDRATTIVLVSHNMANIVQQCDRVIWLDRGTVRAVGDPEAVAEQYLKAVHTEREIDAPATSHGTPGLIRGVCLRDGSGAPVDVLEHGKSAVIDVAYELDQSAADAVVEVVFREAHGTSIGGLTTRLDGITLDRARGHGVARLILSPVLFTRGAYSVGVAICDSRLERYLDMRPKAVVFTVDGPSVASREVSGFVVYPHRWEVHGR
jgi:ABC-type polysaccharide/polyol phosphate transport system ATPase subunit